MTSCALFILGSGFGVCLTLTSAAQSVVSGTVPGTLLYSRTGSPNGTVYVASGDGTKEIRVTDGEQPRLSPDGRYFLFHRDRSTYSQANLYVHDFQAGTEWELADGGSYIVGYDWTTNGDRIVFDYSCDIEIIDRSGANRGGFVGGDCYDDSPSISRVDGTVAFHNIHSGLWLANADGSAKRQIPGTIPNDVWPVWSPDGQWIAFMNGPDFYKIAPDGSGRTNLTSLSVTGDTFNPIGAWTPDGGTLVVGGTVLGTNGLYGIATDGSGTLIKIPGAPGAAFDWVGAVVTNLDLNTVVDLAVSATSSPNPVLTNAPLTVTITISNLFPAEANSVVVSNRVSDGVQILSANSSQGSYTISGQDVIFELGNIPGGGSATVGLVETSGVEGRFTNQVSAASARPELLLANNQVVLASIALPEPFVRGMVYSSADSPDGTIWLSPADGGADQLVTTGQDPHLSPNGRYLVFMRGAVAQARGSLYVRNLQTGEETLVFGNNDYVVGSGWTADSSQVIFDYQCGIYAVNRDGSGVHPLFNRDCYDDVPSVCLGTGALVYHNIHSGLWLAAPDGSAPQLIPNTHPGDIWPTWSPDGQEILFTDGVNLFKIRPDGSGRTQLTFLTAPDAVPQAGAWSVDSLTAFVAATIGGTNSIVAVAADGSGRTVPVSGTSGTNITFVGSINAPRSVSFGFHIVSAALAGDGSVTLHVESLPGSQYTLEATFDLNPTQWTPVRTNAASSNIVELVDADAPRFPRRFYRVLLQPGP